MAPTRLQFHYKNWRGEEHTYLVTPLTIVFERTNNHQPKKKGEPDRFGWVLRAQVMQRDNEDRPGIRSFLLTDIRDLIEVERA